MYKALTKLLNSGSYFLLSETVKNFVWIIVGIIITCASIYGMTQVFAATKAFAKSMGL